RGLPDRYLEVLRHLAAPVQTEAERELEQGAHTYSGHLDEVDSAIGKLLQQLEEVNPKAAAHARGVSSWCTRLARRLAFSEKETTFVTRCGLLHDIGDLEIAPSATPGPEHVVAGERILRENMHLVHFAPIVRAHHEWLDGTGYPCGLLEEQIPLAARIVSVADAFNDLITGDVGRKPLSEKAALAEITRACGTRFDVTVVSALHALIHAR
ncbi:MAG: HD domain-containing protein, partial [Candidatus Eremiobacteraeota bacterium]|nr:HD domain-containing protein [Candidatus Eremiobacteraeota bacterium]